MEIVSWTMQGKLARFEWHMGYNHNALWHIMKIALFW